MKKQLFFALSFLLIAQGAHAQTFSNTAGIRAYDSSVDANKVTAPGLGTTTDAACANGSSTCSSVALLKGILTAAQDTTPSNVQGTVNVASATTGGCTPYGYQSAASTNSTNIKSAAGTLCGGMVINTTATLYYVRLYNSSSAPTCSSATNFVATIPVPASTTGAGTIIEGGVFGWAFSNGISFCLTGGGTSTDNTNAALGVFLTLVYK